MLKKILCKINKNNLRSNDFVKYGFHGDEYLIRLVDFLVSTKVEIFIETGTNAGSTLVSVAKKYPILECYSCEPDSQAFSYAKQNIKGIPNISLYKLLSQDFLEKLNKVEIFNKRTLFWLDAHGYGFDWPLKKEIEFITKNFKDYYILIDDFKVPGRMDFAYDEYNQQICSYEFIKESICDSDIELFYPNYREKTSDHHPLIGWGLLVKSEGFKLPDTIDSFLNKQV